MTESEAQGGSLKHRVSKTVERLARRIPSVDRRYRIQEYEDNFNFVQDRLEEIQAAIAKNKLQRPDQNLTFGFEAPPVVLNGKLSNNLMVTVGQKGAEGLLSIHVNETPPKYTYVWGMPSEDTISLFFEGSRLKPVTRYNKDYLRDYYGGFGEQDEIKARGERQLLAHLKRYMDEHHLLTAPTEEEKSLRTVASSVKELTTKIPQLADSEDQKESAFAGNRRHFLDEWLPHTVKDDLSSPLDTEAMDKKNYIYLFGSLPGVANFENSLLRNIPDYRSPGGRIGYDDIAPGYDLVIETDKATGDQRVLFVQGDGELLPVFTQAEIKEGVVTSMWFEYGRSFKDGWEAGVLGETSTPLRVPKVPLAAIAHWFQALALNPENPDRTIIEPQNK